MPPAPPAARRPAPPVQKSRVGDAARAVKDGVRDGLHATGRGRALVAVHDALFAATHRTQDVAVAAAREHGLAPDRADALHRTQNHSD